MGIQTAVHLADAEPVSWDGIDRRGSRSGERFPWEQGSPDEHGRGRIQALIGGVVLAGLVMIANAEPIAELASGARQLAGVVEVPPARAAESAIVPVRAAVAPAEAAIAPPERAPLPPRAQLGSYPSEARAREASTLFAQKHAAILEGRELHVSSATVGDAQVHRVAVHLASQTEARLLCEKIRKAHSDCFVMAGG